MCLSEAVKLLDALDTPKYGLRIGLVGGGCSGFNYKLEWINDTNEDDRVFNFGRLKVIIDPRSFPLLKGTVMDWECGLMQHGFKLQNPNAKSGCGCGASFDV